jgi:hypothetical protein
MSLSSRKLLSLALVANSHRSGDLRQLKEPHPDPLQSRGRSRSSTESYTPKHTRLFAFLHKTFLFTPSLKEHKGSRSRMYSFVQLRALRAFVRKCLFAFLHKSPLTLTMAQVSRRAKRYLIINIQSHPIIQNESVFKKTIIIGFSNGQSQVGRPAPAQDFLSRT